MKIVGYTALHYGRDYLAYAIRSVIDYLDEYHVIYTAIGSHGHRNGARCPETREELYAIAQQAAGDKLRWHEGVWAYEGQQREMIHQYAPDADVIIVLDADEIWPEIFIASAVTMFDRVAQPPRRVRLPMIHYWRSLHKAILHDPAFPERIIYPKMPDGIDTHRPVADQAINHMGYAQRPEIVEYKQLVHGHRNEWRKDVEWFRDVFLNEERRTDLHPVGSQYWNYEEIDPWDYLPEFMKSHPYADMDFIR